MIILLFGAPGSGKGTQSSLISKFYSFPIVTMGDIVRNEIADCTKRSLLFKYYLDRGSLVPDELINEMFCSYYKTLNADSIILDGYPRTVSQAMYLNTILKVNDQPIYRFFLEVSDKVLEDRLLSRGRSDDTLTVIQHRLKTYHQEIGGLKKYYRNQYIAIDANKPVNEINNEILDAIKNT